MFKSGMSGNPKGRPRRTTSPVTEVLEKVLNAQVTYRENNKTCTASRLEVRLKLLIEKAAKGNADAAALLLERRTQAVNQPASAPQQIVVLGFLPDFPGQTAAQKTDALRKTAGPANRKDRRNDKRRALRAKDDPA